MSNNSPFSRDKNKGVRRHQESHYNMPMSAAEQLALHIADETRRPANDLQEAEAEAKAAAAALEIANKNRPPQRPTTSKPYGGSRSRRLRTKRKSKLLTKRRRSRQSRTKRRNLFGGGYNCTSSEVYQGFPDNVIGYGDAPTINREKMPKPYTRTQIGQTNTYTDGTFGPDGKQTLVAGGDEDNCTQTEINERRKDLKLAITRPKGGYKRLSLKTKQKRRSKKSRK